MNIYNTLNDSYRVTLLELELCNMEGMMLEHLAY